MSIKTKVLSTAFILGMLASPIQGQVYANESQTKLYSESSQLTEHMKVSETVEPKQILESYLLSKSKQFNLSNKQMSENFTIKDYEFIKNENFHHYRLQQLYKGIPIYGAEQTFNIRKDTDKVTFYGEVVSDIDIDLKATTDQISEKKAISIATAGIEASIGEVNQYDSEITAEKYIYKFNDNYYPVYLVKASTTSPEVGYWHYFVNIETGQIIDSFNAANEITAFGYGVFGDKQMFKASYIDGLFKMYDQTRGDGVITYDYDNNINEDIVSRSKLFTDGAAVDAHANSQKTYDYYQKTFDRNSVDDQGQRLLSRVHVGDNWNNASWNGVYMSYGDGDGIRFHPLAGGLDVAAHEMSHGVIQHTAGLIYRNESGALNESFADIFGAMVNRDDWIIGEDIMANGAIGLRSMEDPASLIENRTQQPYPDHWDRRYTGSLDNGGVHINSSINNKAAYLVSEGGEHYGVEVTGVGREKTEQIFYRALSVYLTPNSTFAMMRQAAIDAAEDLYGEDSAAVTAVEQAYNAVGVQ
ncbi:M4 family metallopeptidase [Cytobacillus kochii]|uniref:M4 family metallopeptidase n=1 Tax=Cytobacillus kochii TaxID=859143 RepID=UPI00402ABD35